MKRHNDLFIYFVGIALGVLGLFFIFSNEAQVKRKAYDVYLFPPDSIEHMVLGYNEIVADSLWLRWIQSLDLCGKDMITRKEYEKKLRELNPENFDKRRAQVVTAGAFTNKKPACYKGWAFQILKAITYLAPKFTLPYTVGGSVLSVLVEDHFGAKEIFDRGLERQPENWRIAFYAGYHYLYELYDPIQAARIFEKVSKNPEAPDWLLTLAASIYSKSGQVKLGLSILYDQLKQAKDEKVKKKIEDKIRELRKQL